jgi:hypothetical protein
MTQPLSRGVWQALVAIAAGNGLYFLLLYPRLPPAWQHQPFVADRGLALDFLLSVIVYVLLRLAGARLTRPNRER